MAQAVLTCMTARGTLCTYLAANVSLPSDAVGSTDFCSGGPASFFVLGAAKIYDMPPEFVPVATSSAQ